MDPYLEEPSLWPDAHGNLIYRIRADLADRVPERYSVLAERYVWLHEPDADTRTRLGRPDLQLTRAEQLSGGLAAVATLSAPATSVLPAVRREGNRFLRIIDRRSRRVVTVIELLSHSNKSLGEDRDAYLAKRNEYLATGTNLVEIDLLRSGERLPVGSPPPPLADYYVVICRAVDFPTTAIWPFTVQDAFPTVPVPLDPEEGVVDLFLKPCLNRAYDEAHYEREIDYSQPPLPPLLAPAASWAAQLLSRRIAANP
jgi:hypothetical protein